MKRSVPLRPHVEDALTAWGHSLRRRRIERKWTAKDLAMHANVSEATVLAAENGKAGTAVGTMMNLSDLLGIPLFGVADRSEAARLRRSGEEILALLPSRVRRTRVSELRDDF